MFLLGRMTTTCDHRHGLVSINTLSARVCVCVPIVKFEIRIQSKHADVRHKIVHGVSRGGWHAEPNVERELGIGREPWSGVECLPYVREVFKVCAVQWMCRAPDGVELGGDGGIILDEVPGFESLPGWVAPYLHVLVEGCLCERDHGADRSGLLDQHARDARVLLVGVLQAGDGQLDRF